MKSNLYKVTGVIRGFVWSRSSYLRAFSPRQAAILYKEGMIEALPPYKTALTHCEVVPMEEPDSVGFVLEKKRSIFYNLQDNKVRSCKPLKTLER